MSKSKQHLIGFADILKQANGLQRGMPVAYLLTFVLIALDEGKTVTEYAERAEVDRFAMSRYITLLGDGGYGWLEKKRPGRGSKKSITLTPAGRIVLSQIERALRG